MSLLATLIEKLKNAAISVNDNGIPLPLLRDPVKDRGSYPLTMFFISFNVALVTLIGKVTNFLGNVDYSNVLWLLGVTGSFWVAEVLDRKVTVDSANKKLDIGDKAD